MQILVDADSCPREAREMIVRFSHRLGIKAVFVANRQIPGIRKLPEKTNEVQMEICSKDEGAADDRIVSLAKPGDLVITRDLPLAERIVEAGIAALCDRGRVFTKENIREFRSLRDFTVGLAETGLDTERIASYGRKELSAFANSLDRELSRLKKEIRQDFSQRHEGTENH